MTRLAPESDGDAEFVAKTLHMAQDPMDAHLSQNHQASRNRTREQGGYQSHEKGHPQIAGILTLHEADHLDIGIIMGEFPVDAHLPAIGLQIIMGHLRGFADVL